MSCCPQAMQVCSGIVGQQLDLRRWKLGSGLSSNHVDAVVRAEVRFMRVWHNTVFLSLRYFLCSTLRCLPVPAWQFPMHLAVSDSAILTIFYAHYHTTLRDNRTIGQL